jgi:predicted RNase H-like HicB family nuclease
MIRNFTAIIEKDGGGYVALCPELDVASQGSTVAEARDNLREAVELFLECASSKEVAGRLSDEIYVTQIEVAVG